MSTLLRYAALAVLGMLVVPGAVFAQSGAQIARSWGLVGAWQVDCDSAPDDRNPVYVYVVRGGQLYVDRDFGADSRDSSAITDVARTPEGAIRYVINFTELKQMRQHTNIRAPDGRMRTYSNKNLTTGEASVVDGKYTSNGQVSQWMTRCG
jgi:hypothetical protein